MPVSDDVPLTAFTYELYHSLCAIGPCLRLTSDVVRKVLHILQSRILIMLILFILLQSNTSCVFKYSI